MPATFELLITRQAQQDLQEIYDHIEADNPARAGTFIKELEAKTVSLAQMPTRAPFIPENSLLGTEYRHLIHGRYRILFRIQGVTVFILRVIHGSKLLMPTDY